MLTVDKLYEVTEATWPPASISETSGWTIRNGAGGGKRVSAATGQGDIDLAENQMRALGQTPLFMVRAGELALDQELEARGYKVIDPVNIYTCATTALLDIPRPRVSGFAIWEPLSIMEELWAEGGIGPERINVMRRAKGPKTSLLGRINDRAAASAFVAIHDGIAMLHALEVTPNQRRQGVARTLMGHAGHWAHEQGAATFSLIVTQQNIAANALYQSLGMEIVGHYHYRTL